MKLSAYLSGSTTALELPKLDQLLAGPPSLKAAPCSDGDIQTVFGAFGLDDLERLDLAFRDGRVVRRSFTTGHGRGCLLYHLNNAITTFGAQAGYFAKDRSAAEASHRLVAAWDTDALTEAHVRGLLAEAIAERTGRARRAWGPLLTDGLSAPATEAEQATALSQPAGEPRPTSRRAASEETKVLIGV